MRNPPCAFTAAFQSVGFATDPLSTSAVPWLIPPPEFPATDVEKVPHFGVGEIQEVGQRGHPAGKPRFGKGDERRTGDGGRTFFELFENIGKGYRLHAETT